MTKSFYGKLKEAKEEREVERLYKNEVEKRFKNCKIANPHSCDGYIEEEIMYDIDRKVLRLIMEFKKLKDFNKPLSRAKVLTQVLFYIKKFQNESGAYTGIPNIILAGDKITCFVIQGNRIYKYLNKKIDWSIAPSEAPDKCLDLVNELKEDENIDPYIFSINNKFNFSEVVKEIKNLLFEIKERYKVTDLNILKIYENFINDIVIDNDKYNSLFLVDTFISLIIDSNDVYLHPKLKNILHTAESDIKVDGIRYRNFESNYSNKYSISERQRILEYRDRLIDDTSRRKKGEFYTPTAWAERSSKEIEKWLGENWREDFIVWDLAWGTGNLTRDGYFNELYCSTLRKEDLEMGECNNPEGIKFKYDFLNDGVNLENRDILEEISIPKNLKESILRNKNIVIYINPPYGEASDSRVKGRKIKKSIIDTKVAKLMKEKKIGSQQQMYTQFIYRILKIKEKYNLTNLYLGMFCPPLFFTGGKSEKLRNYFKDNFEYLSGFLFKASNFANVSDEWGISFTLWKSGKNLKDIILSIENNTIDKGIVSEGYKKLYSIKKEKRLSEWIKKEQRNEEIESIKLKSAIVHDNKTCLISSEDIGYLINDSNNIYANSQGVYIINSKISRHIKTTTITKNNIEKAISIYVARSIIKSTWINSIDEYIIPNKEILKDKEWLGDALIYSIFSNKSQQSSLRNIKLDNKTYNIFNEFFFMSNEEIRDLADKEGNLDLLNDSKKYKSNRYVYLMLQNYNLSNEAKTVLEEAIKLTKDTIKYRERFNDINPESNINSWDAGWYQIKLLIKYYEEDNLKEFNKYLKVLENKIRENIYKYNFLIK